MNEVSHLDLRTPGAEGGELTFKIMLCISRLGLRSKRDEVALVEFDDTTSWILPKSIKEDKGGWPDGLALDLHGWKGLHGESH